MRNTCAVVHTRQVASEEPTRQRGVEATITRKRTTEDPLPKKSRSCQQPSSFVSPVPPLSPAMTTTIEFLASNYRGLHFIPGSVRPPPMGLRWLEGPGGASRVSCQALRTSMMVANSVLLGPAASATSNTRCCVPRPLSHPCSRAAARRWIRRDMVTPQKPSSLFTTTGGSWDAGTPTSHRIPTSAR